MNANIMKESEEETLQELYGAMTIEAFVEGPLRTKVQEQMESRQSESDKHLWKAISFYEDQFDLLGESDIEDFREMCDYMGYESYKFEQEGL